MAVGGQRCLGAAVWFGATALLAGVVGCTNYSILWFGDDRDRSCAWIDWPLGVDDERELKLVAADALARAQVPRTAVLRWHWTRTTTEIDLELFPAGEPSWRTGVVVDSASGEPLGSDEVGSDDVEALCPSHISLPMSGWMYSSDGALDVEFSTDVMVRGSSLLEFEVELTHEDWGGSGIQLRIDPEEWREVWYVVHVRIYSGEGGRRSLMGTMDVFAEDIVAGDGEFDDEVARWPD